MVKKSFKLVFVLFLLMFAGNIFAQSNSSDKKNDQPVTGLTVKGVVTGINLTEKRIVILEDTTRQKRTFSYNDRTMWRNPVTPATIDDLKDGDRITLLVTDTTITRADISVNKSPINTSRDTRANPQ